MKKLLYIFGILSLFTLWSFKEAGFHSSMTTVDYVEPTKTLKFKTKLNANDVAKAIKIDVNTAGFEAQVKQYLGKKFDVYVNGSKKTLTFTGSQVSGSTVWVYFEAKGVDGINTLKIRNSILLDTFPNQLNLVNIAFKGQQKTMNFRRGTEVNEVNF